MLVVADTSPINYLVLLEQTALLPTLYTHGLTVTGTHGVLERAAERGLIDLPSTLARLSTTSFRVRDELLQAMLARDAARKSPR